MALSSCKELKKIKEAADGQLLSYDKYIFNHFTFFPALCGGDDEGDRAAMPCSYCTTSIPAMQEFWVN